MGSIESQRNDSKYDMLGCYPGPQILLFKMDSVEMALSTGQPVGKETCLRGSLLQRSPVYRQPACKDPCLIDSLLAEIPV